MQGALYQGEDALVPLPFQKQSMHVQKKDVCEIFQGKFLQGWTMCLMLPLPLLAFVPS